MVNLELKLFYKTQRELATALNEIVDAYWDNTVSEDSLMQSVSNMYINNPNKIIKQEQFTTILKQQCGKRRLEVIERVLLMTGMMKDQNTIVVKAGS
ncbi:MULTISPECIES: TIGR04540 family protein [Paenibacillus]|uniref:TIGR04540 family protein n=1 Tax=Paenibacillus urinalis TaxID=521520 RepID=A0AAX3N5G6_9BACL|nr:MULTISPECIES: TIGR04540 family protein [Paenibacillus]WDH85001.1 TIGR04540 family protein [Paenibacillus urinalis]